LQPHRPFRLQRGRQRVTTRGRQPLGGRTLDDLSQNFFQRAGGFAQWPISRRYRSLAEYVIGT
jgi:hypothetical protein